jgi:hypothetical protein
MRDGLKSQHKEPGSYTNANSDGQHDYKAKDDCANDRR